MQAFYSTNDPGIRVSFAEAVRLGISPDGGLFMPQHIPAIPQAQLAEIHRLSFPEMSVEIADIFLEGAVDRKGLEDIIFSAIDFDAPLVRLSPQRYVLELFHGPTLAFKDFGARFLARTLAWLGRGEEREVTVLVATSGDTGSAVAQGFYQVPGVKVCLLYPSGKVSRIQEQQLTTMGGNITALEVEGSFDDCQRMVKEAFADRDLQSRVNLTSANSINIARLLPQMFYYFRAWAQLEERGLPLVISVPSGNFGNLCAGLMAWKMGMPVHRFIAATNANDVVPEYLREGIFRPRPSVQTISNAMDVGAPSNFARMKELFGGRLGDFQAILSGYSFDDAATLACIRSVYERSGYILDPHGAVAFLGLDAYLKEKREHSGIFLETAHPAKFGEIVEEVLQREVPVPERLAACLHRQKQSVKIRAGLGDLKEVLLASG